MNFVGMDKMSLLDYEDKVSCVLFCKPCNFRCPFCHNGLTVLNSNEEMPFEEILKYLKKRIGVIDAVVFSGGEVTLMDDLYDKVKTVKEMGFLVKIDTNGTYPEVIRKLLDDNLVDYIAMDIKNSKGKYILTTDTRYNLYDRVYETYKMLVERNFPFELRTTLVQEFHEESDMELMGQAFKDAPKMYLQKFVEREGCLIKGLHQIDEDQANKFKCILQKYMKNVNLRGY